MNSYDLDKVRSVCEFLGPTTPFSAALMAEGYKRRGMLAPSQDDVTRVLAVLEDPATSATRVRLVALSINARLVAEHPTSAGRDFTVILRQTERAAHGAGISRGPIWDACMEMSEVVDEFRAQNSYEKWRGEELVVKDREILRRAAAVFERESVGF